MTVARFFVIGKLFGYSDKEIWRMVPRTLIALLEEKKELEGHGRKKVTIDDVIPF